MSSDSETTLKTKINKSITSLTNTFLNPLYVPYLTLYMFDNFIIGSNNLQTDSISLHENLASLLVFKLFKKI